MGHGGGETIEEKRNALLRPGLAAAVDRRGNKDHVQGGQPWNRTWVARPRCHMTCLPPLLRRPVWNIFFSRPNRILPSSIRHLWVWPEKLFLSKTFQQ